MVCQFRKTGLTGLGDTLLKWLSPMMLLNFTGKEDYIFAEKRRQKVGEITSLFLKGYGELVHFVNQSSLHGRVKGFFSTFVSKNNF